MLGLLLITNMLSYLGGAVTVLIIVLIVRRLKARVPMSRRGRLKPIDVDSKDINAYLKEL